MANDRTHCGDCNQHCGTGAQCVCKPIVCSAGQILCADTCVDPNTDERACGGCTGLFVVPQEIGGEDQILGDDTGVSEATCNNGECYCDVWSGPPDRCVVGDGAYCANFQQARENCGGCGLTCANNEHCVAGTCVPECGPDLTFEFAPPELMMANLRSFCVNGDVVGTRCVVEASCEAGRCVCPNGQVACRNPNNVADGASETHCADLSTSLLHCGACGVRCAQGMTCSVPLTCAAGKVPCGNECIDVTSDVNNCGACSRLSGRWAFFEGGDDASPNCATPWSCSCGWPGTPDVCGTQCTDLQRDQYNRGACGIACPEGQVCRNGQCGQACEPRQTYCNGYCILGATCGETCDPSKERCLAGTCVTAAQ
ncbi:MAG TPA: hypothetical protein VKP30_00740 [Polyangiaceae bacterium]|nr:hypothetical protein [Polyangiaceae bacterium]